MELLENHDNLLKCRINYLSGLVASVLLWAGMALAWAMPALAVPEAELSTRFATEVQPFVEENFVNGTFPGKGGITLHYRELQHADAKGTALVVNGRTEFSDKYAELFYDLRDLPVSFYTFDHRGQGRSERLLADPNKGYVVNFDDYISDLATFVDTVVADGRQGPLIIVAHSMGGLVSTLYAAAHPDAVQGLILCAPMLGIRTAPLPEFAARLLARGGTALGFADHYVPGGKPFDPDKPFRANDVTHSESRFALNQRLVVDTPQNALGSATFGWVDQAFAGMDRLAAVHSRLPMPVLLMQAGDDTVVRLAPQTEFCRALPRCTLVELPGARHEILMERDEVRDQALVKIREFVASIVAVGSGRRGQ